MDDVECIASASYPGNPRTVVWEGIRLEIERTLAQWRTPQVICYKAQDKDGRVFRSVMKRLIAAGVWSCSNGEDGRPYRN